MLNSRRAGPTRSNAAISTIGLWWPKPARNARTRHRRKTATPLGYSSMHLVENQHARVQEEPRSALENMATSSMGVEMSRRTSVHSGSHVATCAASRCSGGRPWRRCFMAAKPTILCKAFVISLYNLQWKYPSQRTQCPGAPWSLCQEHDLICQSSHVSSGRLETWAKMWSRRNTAKLMARQTS